MSTPVYNSKGLSISTPGSGSDAFSTNSNQSRTLPRQVSTGSLRGTQTVGYGGVQIDGSHNRIVLGSSGLAGGGTVGTNITLDGANDVITVTNTDGSKIGMGIIPDNTGQFGFFSLDPTGNLIMKIVNGTQYVYNPKDSFVNVTQSGLLPDGSGGFVVAEPGDNVSDAYS